MTTRTGPLRTFAQAAAMMVAVILVTACGSSAGNHDRHATSHTSSPIAAAQPLRAGERFLDLTVSRPYTPSPPTGGTDEYRCMVIDPRLTTPTFLTGSQFRPQNEPIVHHAIVFAIPAGDAATARAKDAETEAEGWTCFGDTNLDGRQEPAWVDTWTPGATETVLQHDVGFRLEPGSLLVLQVHYNLLATGGSPAGADQSSVRLRLTDGTAATKPLETLQLSAPIELPCADGESGPLCDRTAAIADVTQRFGAEVGHSATELVDACSNGTPVPGDTQHCDISVPVPITMYAAFGHMHLLGDTLRVTCTHDATLRQQLPQLSGLPPRYVVWGDGSSDEMCLGLLTATIND